jgi:hypothetical protein
MCLAIADICCFTDMRLYPVLCSLLHFGFTYRGLGRSNPLGEIVLYVPPMDPGVWWHSEPGWVSLGYMMRPGQMLSYLADQR